MQFCVWVFCAVGWLVVGWLIGVLFGLVCFFVAKGKNWEIPSIFTFLICRSIFFVH